MRQQQYLDALNALARAYTAGVIASAHVAPVAPVAYGGALPEHGTYYDVIAGYSRFKQAHNTLREAYIVAFPNGPNIDEL